MSEPMNNEKNSKKNNYAFIDSQNLYFGMKRLGWSLDYRRFRVYLEEKYGVKKAYMFLGFLPGNNQIYTFLQEAGYTVVFKPILEIKDGKIKGNCDAELVLHAMINFSEFDKAIIVSGDGDFHCLVDYLLGKNKLEKILAASNADCSSLLKKVGGQKVGFISDLQHKLCYKKKNAP
jgi:uncharacterized LabA/DUF88 family protein